MALIDIPVRADLPSHTLRIDLEGVVYTLRFKWNVRLATWMMDIADAENGDLVNGIAVRSNVDLIGHISAAAVPPGVLLAYDETGQVRNPDRDTFGVEVKLFYNEAAGS